MQLSELALPELDITSHAFAQDPIPQYREAVGQHWLAQTPAGYLVLGYRDMKALLSMDDKLDVGAPGVMRLMGAGDGSFGRFHKLHMLARNGADHKRLRELVAPVFTPLSANQHRPVMAEVVSALLDSWEGKQAFDFTEFASYFPITVLCRLIGADPALVPEMKEQLEIQGLGASLDPSLVPRLEAATDHILALIDGLLKAREAQPPKDEASKDLLDQLLDAAGQEGGLSREELYYMVLLLFIAGFDTSKNLLSLMVHFLLDRPADWQRLPTEEGYAKSVVDETLRYAGIITTYRIVREDFEYKEVTLPKGAMLVFPLSLAGRDESVYGEAANAFIPGHRAQERPIAFGRGIHICLGQFIARVQLEVGLPLIAARWPNLKRDGEVSWRTFPGIWGLKTLPVRA